MSHSAEMSTTTADSVAFAIVVSVDTCRFVWVNFLMIVRLFAVLVARFASCVAVFTIRTFTAPNLAALALDLDSRSLLLDRLK